jgi:hypothetical protein
VRRQSRRTSVSHRQLGSYTRGFPLRDATYVASSLYQQ